MNIAIIEDDLVIREKLSLLLQDAGYQTTLIEDFEHVVDTLLEEDANLILLDINLPFMDGYDICKKIKEKSNIPIIFVNSIYKTEDEIKSIQV